jgi:hypothetical protein
LSQPGQTVQETLSQKKSITEKVWWSGSRCRPWVQTPSTTKKKKKKKYSLAIALLFPLSPIPKQPLIYFLSLFPILDISCKWNDVMYGFVNDVFHLTYCSQVSSMLSHDLYSLLWLNKIPLYRYDTASPYFCLLSLKSNSFKQSTKANRKYGKNPQFAACP